MTSAAGAGLFCRRILRFARAALHSDDPSGRRLRRPSALLGWTAHQAAYLGSLRVCKVQPCMGAQPPCFASLPWRVPCQTQQGSGQRPSRLVQGTCENIEY